MDQWLTAKHGTDGKGSEGARPVKAAHWVGLSSITLEPRVRHRRQQPVPADYLPAKRQRAPPLEVERCIGVGASWTCGDASSTSFHLAECHIAVEL